MEAAVGAGDPLITIAITHASLSSRNRGLAALLEVSNLLSGSADIATLWDAVMERLLEGMEFEAGRLYLMEPDGQVLDLVAARGIETGGLARVGIDQGFTGLAARSRNLVAQRVADLGDPQRTELLASLGLKVVVCVPLIARDRVWGVLNLAARREITLADTSLDLLIVAGHSLGKSILNRRLIDELQDKARVLEEQQETLRYFSATAYHDLKSPMVGIHGLAHRLVERYAESLDDGGRRCCLHILQATERMQGLVTEINDYVKARHNLPQPVEVELAAILEAVHGDVAEELERRGVVWEVPQAAPTLRADKLGLIRVLQNLVQNALKYGGEGLRRIAVHCREEADAWIFAVHDDGAPIPAEEQEHLFEPFTRMSTSQGAEGTGLGLAIVAEVVGRHGGRVWVESGQGQGVTFHFTLAKDPAQEAA